MTGPTHAITGLATVVAIGRLTPVAPDVLALLTVLCGVLAPDIDGNGVITRPGTILRRLVGRTIGDLIDFVVGIFVGALHLVFEHRGFIHSPMLALAMLVTGIGFAIDWLVWFSVGYTIHLIADAFTATGIPFFSPFSTVRVSYARVRVGGGTELIFAIVLLLLTCLCGWTLLPEDVKATHAAIYYALTGA